MKYAVKFRRTCIIAILTLIIPLLFSLADANITISNVSPADGAIHIEIENNPPDPAGYVNLSFQLNDSTDAGDMEFILEVYNGTGWEEKLHHYDETNGSWYHHWDEYPANETNQTCQWRLSCKDGTTGVWTNQTFSFTTDRVPDKPIPVSPSNGSYVEKGDIPLSVAVNHPDYEWGFTGLNFDGVNDEVVVNHSDDFNVSSFTVDTYINVTTAPSTNSYNAILGHKSDANTGYGVALYENHTGIMYLLASINNDEKIYCNCTYLVVNTWYHIAVTYDADTHILTFYVDGTAIYSITEDEVPTPTVADLMIGGPPFTGLYKNFNGLMDYIRLYNRALTPSEVKANYYGKNDNCVTDGIVGYWKFDEGSGTTASDSSGNNHNGTLENGVAWTTQDGGSTTYYGKIYNVTFYEYPSGRIIGWNRSATGWTNGQIVKCNSTYHLEYEGTKYYWYAKSMDDEYWSDASDVYYVETYYNDTEPSTVYYSQGADIYVNPVYAESEPSVVYYSTGADINIVDLPQYHNMQPANASTGNWLSVELSADVNKTLTDATYWDFSFQTNNTQDSSWATIKTLSQVKVNNSLNSISVWFSGLDWNTTYYWRISAYNATFDRYSISPVYHFTTLQNDTEPSTVYYSQGADIYVEPVYTDTEPDKVYYSTGGQISIYHSPEYYNSSPNGTTNEWLSVPLSIEVNKTGDANYWNFAFLTNDTVNGSWVTIKTLNDVLVNGTHQTLSVWFSGLDWGKKYWWYISAYNLTLGVYSNSSVYSFTALQNDSEPNVVYYSLGADIYVNPIYTTSEPNTTYYSVGSQISISPPHPEDPIPADNTAYGSNSRDFSVYISDIDENDTIDKVEFYIGGSKYGEVADVSANSRATLHVSGLTNYTWYQWYVKVYDGNWVITSDTWHYRPANAPPMIDEDPDNGSTNVAVYRKLVGGEWKHFVRLYWNLTDGDGDGMSFRLWVKDPTTGDWIQRWTILDYSMHNGSYYQDEELFNETGQTYYWKVWASDGKNETTQIFHFFTQFFIDFWWTPEYPTQEDTIHFYSLTEGADNLNWSFGDGHYADTQNATHQYALSNYYNVTLTMYNATNNVTASLTKWIRIDRNITLHKTDGHAGINYFMWHLPNQTTLEKLAENLSLSKGEWLHYYNKSKEKWDSLWYQYTGENVKIGQHDVVVITVSKNHKARINTTANITYSRNVTATPLYNYIGWSPSKVENVTNMTNYGFADGDWVHYYDTVNGTWKSRWLSHAGDKYDIHPYDVMVCVVDGDRNIMMGD